PRPALLPRPGALRPRTLRAGGKGRAPAVLILPLRRRPAPMPRRRLRTDGRRAAHRNACARVAFAARARPPRRGSARTPPAREARYADECGEALSGRRQEAGAGGRGRRQEAGARMRPVSPRVFTPLIL